METVLMVNKSARVYCLGEVNLIPQQLPADVPAEYQNNPEIKAAIESGDLEVVEKAEKPVDDMTVAELKQYAAAKEIDLGEAKNKPEILAVIKAAQV